MRKTDIFEELKRERIDKEFYINKCSLLEKQLFEVVNELKKTQEESEKESKPRGKPVGSNGGTKEVPENVDRKINARL